MSDQGEKTGNLVVTINAVRKRLKDWLVSTWRDPPALSNGKHDGYEEVVAFTNGLTKRFGNETAVTDLTFQIPSGTIFGLIGPSGCGKTTTVRLLTGFYRPTSGSATVLGLHPTEFDPRTRARIGYMPQHFVLYPDLTVWENLNFARSIYGVSSRQNDRPNQLLDFVELSEHKSKITHNLSGGMQRRLSLAATLVHDPELLFLDEPTGGIDPLLRQKLWKRFHELQKEGRTLFITTQYVSEAAYCDLIGLLVKGRLIALDTPEELRCRALGGEAIDVRLSTHVDSESLKLLEQLSFVREVMRLEDAKLRIILEEASTAVPLLVEWYGEQGIHVESIQEYLPPFDEIFVRLVEQETQ
jgi:ABC-2 type transport system ATP-binding protein